MVDAAAEAVVLAFSAAFALRLVVVVAGDVEEEISRPSSELLSDQGVQGDDGGLFGKVLDLFNEVASLSGILVLGHRDKDHVAGHVPRGFVVFAVGDLPGKVWNEESRVADPADRVVENLAGGEGLVTTFMSKNPQAGADQTIDDGIEKPQACSYWGRGDILGGDETVKEIEGGGKSDYVSTDIVQTFGSRSLEAVLGDGLVNITDGVVRDFKGIPVGVDKLDLLVGTCNNRLLEDGIF